MPRLRVSPTRFVREYRARTRTLSELAETLPRRPDAETIHDLRVTARRLQTMCRLMPGEVRGSREVERFSSSLKSLLKTTSRVRDLDTFASALHPHEGSVPKGVLTGLVDRRADAALEACAASGLWFKAPDVLRRQLGGKKLSRRLERRVRSASKAMEQLLDSVARDESNAGDLHALRKEVKKLRYLLELAPGTENEVSALADWQEVLGSIHDLDVTIEYVKQDARGARAEGLLRELQLSRRSKYLEFVKRRGGESARILRGGGMPSVRRR